MKFCCPACKSVVYMEKTADGTVRISCESCKIADTLPFGTNPDEVFLDFLVRYDGGQLHLPGPQAANSTGTSDMATVGSADSPLQRPHTGSSAVHQKPASRPKSEIDEMLKGKDTSPVMRQVLYSKKDYLAEYKVTNEPEPKYGHSPYDAPIDRRLADVLASQGISRFYRFQDEAIKSIISGKDTVIEAPTASGKTEAFVVPVVQRIINSNAAAGAHEKTHSDDENNGRTCEMQRIRAVFAYPTKALAADQLPKIQGIARAAGLGAELVDGDTGASRRSRIISNPPHILVTNFDLIHHNLWRRTSLGRMLKSVDILIVDEVHTYSGIFGSNVHYIIKRLARIAQKSGRIQVISASATLDNPEQFCRDLFDADGSISHIRGSGPGRVIEFAMLFPLLRKPRALMADLTKRFSSSGHKTMAFSNSHRGAELLAAYCQRKGVRIRVHRAGLTPEHRASTESQFKDGTIQAVSCTSTLELGIDIGSTDCVISAPTPINRLTQRIGRAARQKNRRAYAFLALGDDPISQYYKNHPGDYFEDRETLYIDPHNPYVKECQIIAMACDMPIKPDEITPHYAGTIDELVRQGMLKRVGGMIMPNMQKGTHMLAGYSIRGTTDTVDIICGDSKVGDRACPIALDELYKGAVYLLAGRSYMVKEFDYPKKKYAVIEKLPFEYPYYTKALTTEYPSIENIIEKRIVNGIETAFCLLNIQKKVTGYVKIPWKEALESDDNGAKDSMPGAAGDSPFETVELESPLEYRYITKGIVFCAPYPHKEVERAAEIMKKAGASEDLQMQKQAESSNAHASMTPSKSKLEEEYITASGYHATEHVVIEGSNMITGGASQNLGGISMGSSGMIFVHDGVKGGSGASRALYDRLEMAFERGACMIAECPCNSVSGCPRCIMSYRCGNNNQYLHKMAALEIFERINSGEKTALLPDAGDGHRPIV